MKKHSNDDDGGPCVRTRFPLPLPLRIISHCSEGKERRGVVVPKRRSCGSVQSHGLIGASVLQAAAVSQARRSDKLHKPRTHRQHALLSPQPSAFLILGSSHGWQCRRRRRRGRERGKIGEEDDKRARGGVPCLANAGAAHPTALREGRPPHPPSNVRPQTAAASLQQ